MSTGQYVYGLVRSDHPGGLDGVAGVGEPAAAPRTVCEGPLAAVVSDAPPTLRAKRRHLLGHQRVVEALHCRGPVLPMRFGVVSDSEDSLRADLRAQAERHLARLDALRGRVEFNAKLQLDEDEMVRRIAESDPTVRRLRRATPTYPDDLRLGKAVAAVVERRELIARDRVLGLLGALSVTTADGPPVRGFALNTSFLVEAHRMPEFRAAVETAEEDLLPEAMLRCTGPLPPYSFAATDWGERWDCSADL